jgi:uncharacterized protein
MPKMIFVNLPVADVEKSTAFYETVGFTKDERFSQRGSVAAMTWSDTIVFMILSRERFAEFTSKTIVDARSSVEGCSACPATAARRSTRSSRLHAPAAARPIPALRKTTASCMAAVLRTSTAMSSSRCGWISMPRWPRWTASRLNPLDPT